VAKRVGKAYAVEPNSDRVDLLIHNGETSNVYVAKGTAEALPFPDKKFDAVVAMWILHYVDDLEKSLREMVRVVDPTAPNACVVIVQGAPDNEVVNLINKACASIAESGLHTSAIDHQGFLLATASKVFSAHGFGDITLKPVAAYCNFPEEDISKRCVQAADVLAGLWYLSHPKLDEMKAAFIPILEQHFTDRAFEVGDQAVILIARPTGSN